jgi:hypothetical protein
VARKTYNRSEDGDTRITLISPTEGYLVSHDDGTVFRVHDVADIAKTFASLGYESDAEVNA